MNVVRCARRKADVNHMMGWVEIPTLINRRRASGVRTRIIKVKAHSGKPLNEAADALAGA